MSTYAQKLKDPRWQRKRLEIMSRDGFTCQKCGSASNTLNVHHHRYLLGRNPWEYPDADLVTLCEKCHESEHEGQSVASLRPLVESLRITEENLPERLRQSLAIAGSGKSRERILDDANRYATRKGWSIRFTDEFR